MNTPDRPAPDPSFGRTAMSLLLTFPAIPPVVVLVAGLILAGLFNSPHPAERPFERG